MNKFVMAGIAASVIGNILREEYFFINQKYILLFQLKLIIFIIKYI